ncbi:MAG: hypothetical protein L3J82_00510 [Planctomycetes bacterium]|nr:hypothetical protein [Planctomycetota bacterium]
MTRTSNSLYIDDLAVDLEQKQVIEHEVLKEVKASENRIMTFEISVADAETNAERIAAELADLLYEASLEDASPPSFRASNSKKIENWTGAIHQLTAKTYEIQNIGRVLVQNLTG